MRETNETHWLICPHCGGKTKLIIREDTLKDVQEYMEHSDIRMTANIYGHLDVQRKQLLTEKMAASIF